MKISRGTADTLYYNRENFISAARNMKWFRRRKRKEENLDKELSEKFCFRFGMLAVEMGFVTANQIKSALAEQVDDEISGKPHRLIGKILFENGWIRPEQIDLVMNRLFKEKKGQEQ